MGGKRKTTLLVFPENWLDTCDFKSFFPHPERRLEVDIGSGKGRFLLARSGHFPEVNFLGIERRLMRVNRSGRKCERAGRDNVRLLRMEGGYAIGKLIPPEYVANYYCFFPDPWPKNRHSGHRLFNPAFITALHRTLESNGCLHAATDHPPYYDEICDLLSADGLFKEIQAFQPAEDERSDFDIMFGQRSISRCSFRKAEARVGEMEALATV